jgi:hypothetical protein
MNWKGTIQAKWVSSPRDTGFIVLSIRLLPLLVHGRSVIESLPEFAENQRREET